jgi:hypothetical protein
MKHLKQFIYLDEYKMYSLSSQIFEGLTEYFLRYGETAVKDEEKQKGELGSGRLLAHVASDMQGNEERRVLHDYRYTLFESELNKMNALVKCDASSGDDTIGRIVPGALLKVTGWADFNDMRAIGDTVDQFNDLGQAITYLTTYEARNGIEQETAEKMKAEKDRNRRARIREAQKAATDINRLAENSGLRMDEKFLKSLGRLLSYGYAKHFELQVLPYGKDSQKPFFSALLNRSCLREDESFIVKKFSRQAQGTFCLFGIVCQGLGVGNRPTSDNPSEPQHLREVVGTMVSALCEIDKSFFGRFENEVIIDPVALYQEIRLPMSDEQI